MTTNMDQSACEPPRGCTCHPDDNPPQPCPRKHALSECRRVSVLAETQAAIVELKNRDRRPYEEPLLGYLMRVRDVLER